MKAKKSRKKKSDDLLSQFDLTTGVRGKYAKRYREGVSVTIYSPNKKIVEAGKKNAETFIMIEKDIAKVFPDAKAVNSALRHLLAAVPSKNHVRKAA